MKYFIGLSLFVAVFLNFVSTAFAAKVPNSPSQAYEKAKVVKIDSEGENNVNGTKNHFQNITVLVLDGVDNGKTIHIESGQQTSLTPQQIVKQDETIYITKTKTADNKTTYQVYDAYRVDSLLYIFLGFLIVVILIAGLKGFGSLIGLAISLFIIFWYIVPQILHGADPLMVSIYGSLAILLLTTYLAHGISKQTTVALLSTFVALMLTSWLSSFFVNIAYVTGFNEETSTLQFGQTSMINVKGLLLGGTIIGTLGALNDITTTQAASIFELAKTDIRLSFGKLFVKGFSIGREHVVSMVNTLVLAYAGTSLALFLFLILNPQKLPLLVIINSEDISDEIVRTISGSIGLILVVPIVTLLAALVCSESVRKFFKDLLYALR